VRKCPATTTVYFVSMTTRQELKEDVELFLEREEIDALGKTHLGHDTLGTGGEMLE